MYHSHLQIYIYIFIMIASQYTSTDPSPVTSLCTLHVLFVLGKSRSQGRTMSFKEMWACKACKQCLAIDRGCKQGSFPLPALQSSPRHIAYGIGKVLGKCQEMQLIEIIPFHEDKLPRHSFFPTAVKKTVKVTVKKYN